MHPIVRRGLTVAADTASLLLGLVLCGAAAAQPGYGQNGPAPRLSVVGTWSGRSPGQGGETQGSDQYKADGSFVSVIQLPNGTMQRLWGAYSTQQTSPRQLHLSFRIHGFLPREICAQAPGFSVSCRPNQVAPTMEADADFLSPSAFRISGATMTRVSGSRLLQIAVPAQLVLAAQAPVQPQMRQPVMPTLHPYGAPTGPGSVQAMHQDDQLQQYRICAVNGGQVIEEQGGAVRCVN